MTRQLITMVMCAGALLLASGSPAYAGEVAELEIDGGDTAFMIMSSALVLFMTVGLAYFYGGLVRRKNVLSIMMQCMWAMGVLSIQWVLFGYSLAFGPDIGGFIGNLDWIGLKGVGLTPHPDYGPTIPHQLFMIFQAKFAIITPALIIGAFAERIKFSAFAVFSLLWATFVYDPVCHWVWGGGFLGSMGALDFAGGTVVHITAGVAALVLAVVLGKRKRYPERFIAPHNLPFAMIGAGILWFGWFGFNAGSALAADSVAAGAFVATNTAAAAAGIMWSLIEWLSKDGKPTTLGFITGVVAGLVAITPAAGFVGPISAMLIGASASLMCYFMVAVIKPALGYDDSLDAFGVHGIGGVCGALATGLLASTAVNPGGADGLFFGNPAQFVIQLKAVTVTIVYTAIVTFIIAKLVDLVIGLRVADADEALGLDLTQHHERAYTLID